MYWGQIFRLLQHSSKMFCGHRGHPVGTVEQRYGAPLAQGMMRIGAKDLAAQSLDGLWRMDPLGTDFRACANFVLLYGQY